MTEPKDNPKAVEEITYELDEDSIYVGTQSGYLTDDMRKVVERIGRQQSNDAARCRGVDVPNEPEYEPPPSKIVRRKD